MKAKVKENQNQKFRYRYKFCIKENKIDKNATKMFS